MAGREVFSAAFAAQIRAAGRQQRYRVQDPWLSSQALQHACRLLTRNRRDFEDIPEEARAQLEFIWLERVEEAIAAAISPSSPDDTARGRTEAA